MIDLIGDPMKKRILLASAMGIGGGLLYLLSRSGKLLSKKSARMGEANAEPANGEQAWDSAEGDGSKMFAAAADNDNPIIDDHGTDQTEALNILTHIRDAAFDSSDEKLALALGRPTEEIEAWTRGAEIIDGDVIMKARGLAMERGIETA
jgi:hypothetical protein